MAQHDYTIANQGFPAFRSDLNDALAAIVSNNSGATEPTTMFAHQMWVDTAANPSILKIRNADNDAWITIGSIDQTGDTFTLTSAVSATTLNTSGAVVFNDAGADVDFRVESDTVENALFVDGASGNVGIGMVPTTGWRTGAIADRVLQIQGNGVLRGQNNANLVELGVNYYINSSNNSIYIASDEVSRMLQNNGIFLFESAASGTAGNTITWSERMRITSDGYLKASNNGSYAGATDNHHEFSTNAVGGVIFRNRNTSAVPYGEEIQFTGASPDNNTNYFLLCVDSTANRTIIYSDGDVWTSDAGTLSSDQKLKNTITDTSPKLDDVMRLRVRNFYWNEDYHPEKTDKKLIGFIAQEFEEVFPGLVTEGVIRGGQPIYEDQAVVDDEGNPVLDEDGNPKTEQVQVGETEKEYAKGIKEGKLIPILVKALQEAVERIETLEAKVAALENA